jgi:hypothetical protein
MSPGDFDQPFQNLTPESLRQMPDFDLPFAVQQYALSRIGGAVEHDRDAMASLPPAVRAVHAALVLDGEVKNGGFNQFFWNSPHSRVVYAVEALEFFGAQEHLAILREAMETAATERDQLLPYHVEGSIRAFSASYREGLFEHLDARYYGLPDLTDMLARVIRANPERFCPA